jgi:1,4-dihydroxy-2-naphthoate polyprenyltransferase
VKNFLIAARLKTLPASVIPPLLSYIYFYSTRQHHEWLYLILCLVGSLSIQLATNFFNDVIDFEKGADKKRVGPTRVSAAGLVNIEKVKLWAKIMIVITIICGVPIIIRGGIYFLILGIFSLYLTYGYTGGRISLAYHGMGELFVFVFFGLFATVGSYYLYAETLSTADKPELYALGSIFGLLTTALIMVNNLRDREFDAEVKKRTLATRMPEKFYRYLSVSVVFLPYALLGFFLEYRFIFIMLLSLPPAIQLSNILLHYKGANLNDGLKFAGLHLLFYSLFLSFVFLNGHSVQSV